MLFFQEWERYFLFAFCANEMEVMNNKREVINKKHSTYAIYVSPDTVNQQVKNKVVELLIPYEISMDAISLILSAPSKAAPCNSSFPNKNILEIFPDVQFYDYTKVPNRMRL